MTKSKQTKSALFSSVVALLLCFTMLLGTTFAWFTDNASSSVNKIQAGTLDIQLLDASGNSLEGQTLSWQKATGHESEEVLWEPGCTYNLQTITIKNNGNLALKYKIEITGIQGDAELNEAIDWTITNSNTVSELGADHSLAVGASDTLTISGHMKETAGNEYQGLSIDGVSITVLATQDTVEYDSFNNSYDQQAVYEKDVQVEDHPWHELDAVQSDTVVDGGGYTYAADYQEVALVGDADITIKGVTFQNGLTIYTTHEASGKIRLENCTIYLNNGMGNTSNASMTQHLADYGLIIGAVSPNVTWEFVNCKFTAYNNHNFTGSNSYNAYIGGNYSAESISFNGCTFEGAGRHGIGCSYAYGSEEIPFTYYNLNVTGCNFVNWNNYNPNNNGAAIRGNAPADVLTQFKKSINISGNTFGNNNGSEKATVAIDGWNGSWS